MDVLCNQDKNCLNNPGYKAYHTMVEAVVKRYMSSTKQEKMKLTKKIVKNMREQHNSRFLEKSIVNGKQVWMEVTEAKAREKVSHKIRKIADKLEGSHRSPSPDDTSMTSKESESEMKSSPHDTVLGALILKQKMLMSQTESSAFGIQDQQHLSDMYMSRDKDLLGLLSSVEREFLIEPFGVRYDSKDTVYNSLRSEYLDAMMAEPVPAGEWKD
ncbi:hypothetical protein FisN_6Hu216 [Fistulifera solaris]|uniref:DUF6824 domain-containing protein n=1 Tax=Fistulifera solaris TaxID=1519565 RepID=A0A1Z5K1W9_FISSO|nr:hypothetical protein FisN_6Hu216 [Fistulifera solaris]|eukprot:GAX20265.1 hypothetical protein FisN_6Hu216 [Fistulifera solaris]